MIKKKIRCLLVVLFMAILAGCSNQKYTREQYLQDYELLKKDGFWEENIATSFLTLISDGTKEETKDYINKTREEVKEDKNLTDKGRKVCLLYLDAYEKIYYQVEDVIGNGDSTYQDVMDAIESKEVTSLLKKCENIRDSLLD